jgi:(1->4)-alpha-D-glucan 1-alpha-D-glucosylmutase
MRDRLRQLASNSAEVRMFIGENLAQFNGKPNQPASFANLQRLLGEQYYVLAFWQNVNETINYRRFFTISDLVGMRVEDSLVFEATHALILRLISRGAVIGLRIDHIDGLRDPFEYLKRLQARLAAIEMASPGEEAYVVVEKILERNEELPADWPVAGTTGYDYLNVANRAFVHKKGVREIEKIYAHFIGRDIKFDEVLYQKKKLVMATILAVEMRALGRQLGELAAQARYARDLPRHELTEALIETTACFGVYRTYIRNLDLPAEATQSLETALAKARECKPTITPACFDFLRDVLLLSSLPHVLPELREARLSFVLRWQQVTGPIVAKGLEDTALYVYYPLLSLNEVGGDPSPQAVCAAEYFDFVEKRRQNWPHSMNASSTHDTKRAEDVRARISVLSEMPEEWKKRLERWSGMNSQHRLKLDVAAVPDRNEEYLLYQTLLGMWPVEDWECDGVLQRLQAYAVKATREAMVHTRWTRPNVPHEDALKTFISSMLDENTNREFLDDFRELHEHTAFYGMLNSLSQTLLKITAPGVPDFYQGSELWDLRLVDPDNRGVVDFERRTALLREVKREASASFAQELTKTWRDGRIKLYLINKALCLRKRFAPVFTVGEFVPAQVSGGGAQNLIAFYRRSKEASALVLAPRWITKSGVDAGGDMSEFWKDTAIDSGEGPPWQNVFTGETFSGKLRTAELLKSFPVALLANQSL